MGGGGGGHRARVCAETQFCAAAITRPRTVKPRCWRHCQRQPHCRFRLGCVRTEPPKLLPGASCTWSTDCAERERGPGSASGFTAAIVLGPAGGGGRAAGTECGGRSGGRRCCLCGPSSASGSGSASTSSRASTPARASTPSPGVAPPPLPPSPRRPKHTHHPHRIWLVALVSSVVPHTHTHLP